MLERDSEVGFALRNSKGFTLIEVILVMAIASALGALIFLGQRQIREQAQFTSAIEKTVTVINKIRNEAHTTVSAGGTGALNGTYVVGKRIVIAPGTGNITTCDMHLTGTTINYSSNCTTSVVPWEVKYQGGTAARIYFTRDIASGHLYTYTASPVDETDASLFLPSDPSNNLRLPLNLSFQDYVGGHTATISVDAKSGTVTRTFP